MQIEQIPTTPFYIPRLPYELCHSDLIQACLASDGEAWKEFVCRYHRVISSAVLRTAFRWGETSKAVLDDLIQDTYLKLCAQQFSLLRQFEFRAEDSIFCFLKTVTTNVVHDYFRSLRATKRGTQLTVDLEEFYNNCGLDVHGGIDVMEKGVRIKEVEEAVDAVTGPEGSRDRNIFWFYYRHGFGAHEIAAMPAIALSAKGVESVLHRLTKLVRRQLTEEACT
jgi:RNA polymerase sigma-70 factor (ECF subfamily)